MSNLFTVSKVRFFEYGKVAPEGSRYRGTLDQQSLIGYYHYTEDEDKNDRKKELDNLHKGGYLGYVNKDEYTFTSEGSGWLKKEDKNQFEKKLGTLFSHDGDIWWETILSFPNEDISKSFGLETVNDYKTLIDRSMPKICKAMNLDTENVLWWANRHVDTEHPHIHLNWIEKNKNRNRGKMTEKELARVKSIISTELVHMQEEMTGIDKQFKVTLFKEKDNCYQELINAIGSGVLDKEIKNIKDLYNILPRSGRLSYNSYAMRPYRKALDTITKKILDDDQIRKYFDDYVNTVQRLNDYKNRHFSTDGDVTVATIRQTELNKLYARIGNMILKDFKKKNIINLSDEKEFTLPQNKANTSGLYYYFFTIDNSLISAEDEHCVFVRIPNTQGQKYMSLDKNVYERISEQTGRYALKQNERVMIYNKQGKAMDIMDAGSIMNYWEKKTGIVKIEKSIENLQVNKKERNKTNVKNNDSTHQLINRKTFRNPKTISHFQLSIKKWLRRKNNHLLNAALRKELEEWERSNNIRHV